MLAHGVARSWAGDRPRAQQASNHLSQRLDRVVQRLRRVCHVLQVDVDGPAVHDSKEFNGKGQTASV